MREDLPFAEIASIITKQAVEAGCPDNVTLLIIDLQQYY